MFTKATADSSEYGSLPINTNSSSVISLPKGGGAIKGISEKFSANPVTGTSSFSIPLPTSQARGFEPQLSLSYDSGAGNGPFGLGWSLSLPSISRKTEKGLPQYLDEDDSDTYILAGVEDLVPLLKEHNGNWQTVTTTKHYAGIDWEVKLYRPRIEAAFTKIERWRDIDTGIIWWRTTGGNNVTSVFGFNEKARVADPTNPAKIFKWLLDCSYNDKGHFTKYVYKSEDMVGVDYGLPYEQHRKQHPIAQTYLKRVWYGIKKPYWLLYESEQEVLQKTFKQEDFHYHTVFDYGEHTTEEPIAEETTEWDVRHDPFSDYRAGFEIRIYRRCKRVISFHQGFNELPNQCEPVSVISFAYDDQKGIFSLVTDIISTGYKRDATGILKSKSLPPMTFGYQAHAWNTEVKTIDSTSLHNLPSGVDGRNYQWVDLESEGLSGMLTDQAGGLYYKQNLGGATFSEARLVSPAPSIRGLASGALQIQDLQGNGNNNVVVLAGAVKGFYRLDNQGEWRNFRAFQSVPNVNFQDPNLRIIDLNGDGTADLLISEDHAFRWYPSAGEAGYDEAHITPKTNDEDTGPAIIFSNESEAVILADMTGDGLSDIVRIRNDNIVYWPNQGYGRFGAKVTMGHSPKFTQPDQFNPGHIRFADLDGSGPADLIYLGENEFRYWLNQSGNSWSEPYATINPFPRVDNYSTVSVIDLLGTGTACVVWSSPLPQNREQSIRYVDLMAGSKPHLMVNYQNGMGKEVTLSYKPSTQFYLEDKLKGEHWVTKLHFPVHCLSKVETYDHITKARFTNSYSYHHGFYDKKEREFRGFGRVDQIDTEEYEHFVANASSNVVERTLHQSPVLTKTWFHTGFFLDTQHILSQYAHEYFASPALDNIQLGEPQLPDILSTAEWCEALRACKGLAIRSEVYGLDGTNGETKPYTIAQATCEIKRIQPKTNNRYASFQVINSESLSLQLDRNPDDPRISHNLVLQTDAYGNPLLSASVAYSRLIEDATLPQGVRTEQSKTHILISQAQFTNDQYGILGNYDFNASLDEPYLVPVAWKSSTHELGNTKANAISLFSCDDLLSLFNSAIAIDYQNETEANQKRLLSQSESRFINDTFDGPRASGELGPLAMSWQSYQLAYTPSLLQSIYADKVDPGILAGGYVDLNHDGNWWLPSSTPIYNRNASQRFYLPDGSLDPLGHPAWIDLDDYFLLPMRSLDAKQNETIAFNDYRLLQPKYLRDANHNWAAVEVDELGIVTKSAIMGKVSGVINGEAPSAYASSEGDNLEYPSAELSYGFYDPTTNHPAFVYTKSYAQHFSADSSENRSDYLQEYKYFDGSSNPVMVKVQAEPGLAKLRNDEGSIEEVDTGTQVRWIGNGRTIINNKGNPVKQYEPYFSVTPEYEDDPALVEIGITPILFYDAAGRNNCKLHPNHSYEKVVFNPWQQTSYDVNDTLYIPLENATKELNPANDPNVGHYFTGLENNEYLPSWYAARINGDKGVEQKRAAVISEAHVNTPARSFTDSLGRTIYGITDNGDKGRYKTTTTLDIEGNMLAVTDDRNNVVMSYRYNMLPPPNKEKPKPALYQNSMDGGEKWTLFDVLGNPTIAWDSRDHIFETYYDELNRPYESKVIESGTNKTVALTFYYDSDHLDADNARAKNLIGAAYATYDQAGLVETLEVDFKGNPLRSKRVFAREYKQTVVWNRYNPDEALQAEYFETTSQYNALNRVTYSQSPHNENLPASENWYSYNESGALNAVDVAIRGGTRNHYVLNMDYDAKGQRQSIEYGNKVTTTYKYDAETYRLIRLVTKRGSNTNLQDLNYTYDPVGNITEIRDYAQQDVIFKGEIVEPHCQYKYDALYQLIEATGREHAVQAAPDPYAGWDQLPIPNSDNEMRNYTQYYTYDSVGNILNIRHTAGLNGWTRYYNYAQDSNRLLETTLGDPDLPFPEKYEYNTHGSMTRMPHLQGSDPKLPSMDWDYAEQLQHVDLVGGGHAWHVYAASGQRTRKIIEVNATIKERIYLGGWEIYRETTANQLKLERETLHVMDDKNRIALIETKTVSEGNQVTSPTPIVRYQLGNHQGSASLELGVSGDVISYEEFRPYGTTAFHAGTNIVEDNNKRYRYTGKERDEETGFAYYGSRYYIGWVGRWIAIDPEGTVDGLNLFLFVGNNIINYIDFYGTNKRKWNNDEIASANYELMKSSIFRELENDASILSFSERQYYRMNIRRIKNEIKSISHETSATRNEAKILVLNGEIEFTTKKNKTEYKLISYKEWNGGVKSGQAFKDLNKIEFIGKENDELSTLVQNLAHEYSHLFDPDSNDSDGVPFFMFEQNREEIFAELFKQLIMCQVLESETCHVEKLKYADEEIVLSFEIQEEVNVIYQSGISASEKAEQINNLVKQNIVVKDQ